MSPNRIPIQSNHSSERTYSKTVTICKYLQRHVGLAIRWVAIRRRLTTTAVPLCWRGIWCLDFTWVLHCFPCTQFRNNRFRDSDHKGPTGLTSIRILRHVRQKSFTPVWSFQSDQALHCSQTFGFLREGVGPKYRMLGHPSFNQIHFKNYSACLQEPPRW